MVSLTSPALGEKYGFYAISSNSITDVLIAEEQLFVKVLPHSATEVLFLFGNTGPAASSLTDIYFDDNESARYLHEIEDLDSADPLVAFSLGAKPKDLPGGNHADPDFHATDYKKLSADSDPKVAPNGVAPGEQLDMIVSLAAGRNFDDVIGALNSGELRIGVRAQAFADGESEALINDGSPPEPVPVPGAALLGALGLIATGIYSRRKMA